SDTDAAYRSLLECDLGFVHQVLTYTRRHSAALTSRSQRMNTYLPNEIRLLIRFGRRVLTRQEYRAAIRHMLARYAWYLLRQALRPARLRDVEFHVYHRSELRRMLGELHADLESRLALISLRLLTRNPAQPTACATRAAESHRVSGAEARGALSANADCNASTSVRRKSAGSSG